LVRVDRSIGDLRLSTSNVLLQMNQVKASHLRKESEGHYRDKESEVSRKEFLSY